MVPESWVLEYNTLGFTLTKEPYELSLCIAVLEFLPVGQKKKASARGSCMGKGRFLKNGLE
jgi:hypothetical protein